ncbi:nicotinate-nucleotide--dimethylbenzimidazole phosphoribosyltransferase [Paenibacillus tarimensis]
MREYESQENEVWNAVQSIGPLDQFAIEAATERLDSLTKPPGSLGRLESIAVQLAGITGVTTPELDRKAVIVMAGDHGVCEEGVSAYPAEVTPQMVMNFLNGGAAVNVLAKQAGAEIFCIDLGVNADLNHPSLVNRKIRYGTANMTKRAAMSRAEAIQAIVTGIRYVRHLVDQGYRLFATGEMGIGNTTASAAIATVLGNIPVQHSVGRGTGIDEARVKHKVNVVERAIETNNPDPGDPIDVLAKVGGLEIAGLTGVIIGAAAARCPVVIDGYISSAAALAALKLAPDTAAYMMASHLSNEQGHSKLLETIGLSPLIHMDMRLGEGTGAVLCFHFIEAALRIMREMATFDSAGVSRGE